MRNTEQPKTRSSASVVGFAEGIFLLMLPLLLKAHPHHPKEIQNTRETRLAHTQSSGGPAPQHRHDHGNLSGRGQLGGVGEGVSGLDMDALNIIPTEEAEDNTTDIAVGSQRGASEDNDLRNVRIESIKTRILKKLRLEERPNITSTQPVKLPRPLADDGYLRDAPSFHQSKDTRSEEFYGTTEQVILLATKLESCPRNKPSSCVSFLSSQSLSPKEAKSATLWVYKRRDPDDVSKNNRTLLVSELNNGKFLAAEKTGVLKRGWMKFDMTHAVRRWLRKSESLYQLIVSCKTCGTESHQPPIETSGSRKPVLVIYTGVKSHRSKRSERECTPQSSACCKESFNISFVEIGWSDWILEPSSYQANYCKGSCNDFPLPVGVSSTHHSSVMMSVSMRQQDAELRRELAPCCTASRMSSISLLYRDEAGAIVKADLPSMKVEACGCA